MKTSRIALLWGVGAVFSLVVALSGCSSTKEGDLPRFVNPRVAQQSEDGMRYWSAMSVLRKAADDDADLDDAEELFIRLRQHSRYTRYGRLATLRLADIARMRQEWEKAIKLYTEFLAMEYRYGHDRESASYASFYIGYSYMRMAPGRCCCMNLPVLGESCMFPPPEERKLDDARKAYEWFRQTASWYTGMKYGRKARKFAHRMEDLLAGHELYVARFYWKRGAWLGTVLRLQTLLMTYKESSLVPEARLLMAKACLKMAHELSRRARRPGEWTRKEYLMEARRQVRILLRDGSVPKGIRSKANELSRKFSRTKESDS